MMRLTLLLAFSLACHSAAAADAKPSAKTPGDAQQGAAKAAVCAACHGPGGNSANPAWPKLAGQHAAYLREQLKAYQSGARQDPIMSGQAAALSAQDIDDLAAYFAAQPLSPGVADPAQVEAAQALYRGGRAADGIPACSACHGPQGLGNAAAAYPVVSGQHSAYSAAQLTIYRDKKRTGTANAQMMSNVAAKLSDSDIEALASYLSGLH